MNYGTLSADGNTDEYTVPSVPNHQGSDRVLAHCSGTFGGGTYKIQFQGNDGSWHDFAGKTDTTPEDFEVTVKPGMVIRGNLAGATTPSLYWQFI